MKERALRNVAASVRQRLLNLAKQRGDEFGLILTRYALERVMYRLSESEYRDEFILKGAMLFSIWSDEPHRSTRDLDLLGRGPSDIAQLEQVFREIVRTSVVNDGLEFLEKSIQGQRIRADEEYEGVRITFIAELAAARISIQIDIGFGDAITPAPQEITFPTLLDFPPPHLRSYPRETVIAEKFEAMVSLGIANSRMKDFYDLWVLARSFRFEGQTLSDAISATFKRRGTQFPLNTPLALRPEFASDQSKQSQWNAFSGRLGLMQSELSFDSVILFLWEFLKEPMNAAARGEPFAKDWPPAGPWS